MSPAPAKTSDEAIVRAARHLLTRGGPAALSMQAVAEATGIRAPSLYKRFAHRDALLDAVVKEACQELQTKLVAAGVKRAPKAALTEMARVYRAFARQAPGLYALMFAARTEGVDVLAHRAAAVAPVMEILEALVPPHEKLPAARMLTAFLHGFISMELSGAFRMGGDVQAAFDYGLGRLVEALQPPPSSRSTSLAVRPHLPARKPR